MKRLIGWDEHRKEERRLIVLDRLLHDGWTMLDGGKRFPCRVPCSVYDTLISAGEIADPYVGENQWAATAVCDRDFAFETSFDASKETRPDERLFLRFDGIDTLGKVLLNGALLGETDNMHRVWEFDVTHLVQGKDNLLRVELSSPNRYIADMQKKRPIWGVDSTMAGYPHLRKAHYMFGWDWGPMLPDAGIWRPVHLMSFDGGRVRSAYYGQRHENGRVTLTCQADIEAWTEGLSALFRVTAPDGTRLEAPLVDGKAEIIIEHPQLWWVRGLGDQPLYTCETILMNQDGPVDTFTRRTFGMFSGNRQSLTLRFVNPLLDTAIDRFGTKGVRYSKADDAHFYLETEVDISDQFFAWLCGFGRKVKIMGPESVANAFAEYLDKIREMY